MTTITNEHANNAASTAWITALISALCAGSSHYGFATFFGLAALFFAITWAVYKLIHELKS